jgi:hypothetical protein
MVEIGNVLCYAATEDDAVAICSLISARHEFLPFSINASQDGDKFVITATCNDPTLDENTKGGVIVTLRSYACGVIDGITLLVKMNDTSEVTTNAGS